MTVIAEINPSSFEVRQACGVEVILRSTHDLHAGDTVEVQFPNTWYALNGPSFTREVQAADPAAPHYISVSAPGDATPSAQRHAPRWSVTIAKRQLNYPAPESTVRHGRHIVATLTEGVAPAGAPLRVVYGNTYAPYVTETDTVWVRVKGEAPERAPTLTVTPGPAQSVRLLAPSAAEPGAPFGALIVSLDRFENLSRTSYDDVTLSTPDGMILAEHLTFRGGARVQVTLPREGIQRLRMGEVVSNAIAVARGARGPYWGDLHIHTRLSHDGQGTDPYVYARQVSGLDFAARADHWDSLGEEGYREVLESANAAYEPGAFVTLLADERNPKALTNHHNIYWRDEAYFLENRAFHGGGQPGDRQAEAEALARLDAARAMLAPHHTGIGWYGKYRPHPQPLSVPERGAGNAPASGAPLSVPERGAGESEPLSIRERGRGEVGGMHWEAWDDPGLRPVMEIYSHHGQSEMYAPQHILAYELNRLRTPERRANHSIPGPYYAQDYWMAGHRPGVIASSDEHSGQGGRRHGGLAAVWAESLTREGVFDALRQRRCYATTGERILLDFRVDGLPMGAESRRRAGTRLPIRLQVWGTDRLVRVEILRYRFGQDRAFAPLLSDAPRPESWDATLELEDTVTGPVMYYARVMQEPLSWPGMAWSSPIWIDGEYTPAKEPNPGSAARGSFTGEYTRSG